MVDVTLTEKQKKLAKDYDKEMAKEQARQEKDAKLYELLEKDCDKIAKFLKSKVKLRPTLLMHEIVNGPKTKQVDMPIDYFLGKDIHFTIISHRNEILPLAKEIQARKDLNGL